jgi:hypothetical protein
MGAQPRFDSLGHARKAAEKLGWMPRTSFAEFVAEMVREEREIAKSETARRRAYAVVSSR